MTYLKLVVVMLGMLMVYGCGSSTSSSAANTSVSGISTPSQISVVTAN